MKKVETDMLDRDVIRDDVSLDAPWTLVESFAGQPREKPEDVNRGADMIAGALYAVAGTVLVGIL